MMGYITNLIEDVDKSHKNLGEMMAICQIIVKSRKMALIIAPSGCGKSTVLYQLYRNTPDSWSPDKLSIAGLQNKADRLTSFRSAIIVDDITTTQSPYARGTTITTLAALCYTHRVEPSMQGQEFIIEDFYGSALIGVQPIILKNLMLLDEWDGSIQDKVLRYYHMYRPLSPDVKPPNIDLRQGIDFNQVNDFEPDTENQYYKQLIDLGNSQWSRARTKEHIIDMLKAVAALESRYDVIDIDYVLLLRLLRPMAFEKIIVKKEQFEGERYLDNTLLLLLVEYYTYSGMFSLAQITEDYKMDISQSYKIMASETENFKQVSKSPTIYKITDRLEKKLRQYNLELKQERMLINDTQL